ncbi:MAG: YkgJ family cysteine cluster protein [Deltaproteobacteria bacterium]|nr:YkgJ family cysteine cluster protein [Deltaproteobacteria bacterium]
MALPLDPELTRPHDRPLDPTTGEPLDCTRCGACCRAGPGSQLVTAGDLRRWRENGRDDLARNTAPGHFGEVAFPTTPEGACVYLQIDEIQDRTLCSIYEDRADVCRAFAAGSWQCLELRRERRSDGRGRSPTR